MKNTFLTSRSMALPHDAAPGSPPARWQRVGALFASHQERVARHLLALTGEAGAVDDLVSETFIRAFEVLDTYEGRSSENTWLLGIATNVARNHRAKARRQSFLRSLIPFRDREADGVHARLEASEGLTRLQRVLEGLPDALREAYVVRVLEDRPLKEAAAILGLPVSTVSAQATRARELVLLALKEEAP